MHPLGGSFLEHQCTSYSAERTIAMFRIWEQAGAMDAYRAHFALDGVHWVWYSALFTVVLCRLFESRGVPHRFDWLLFLPLASGLLDWYENQLQQLFLSAPDHATIVDPLPLLSTLASLAKWSFALVYVGLSIGLLVRGGARRSGADPA